jgi:hypothetical protein
MQQVCMRNINVARYNILADGVYACTIIYRNKLQFSDTFVEFFPRALFRIQHRLHHFNCIATAQTAAITINMLLALCALQI